MRKIRNLEKMMLQITLQIRKTENKIIRRYFFKNNTENEKHIETKNNQKIRKFRN